MSKIGRAIFEQMSKNLDFQNRACLGNNLGKIVKMRHNSQDGHQMITSCEFHPYSTIFERYIEFGDSSVKIGIFGNFNGLKPCQDAYFRTWCQYKSCRY